MDLELKPCCYIYDTQNGLKKYDIPHLSVEDAFIMDDLDYIEKSNIKLDKFINDLNLDNNEFVFDFDKNLNDFIYNNKIPQKIINILAQCKGEIDG